MKFAKKTIPTDIAIVSQWDEAKGHGVATIDGLNYFVKQTALRNLYNTPKVGDKIIVYKYNKTENGELIVDGKLECVTVVSGGASLRTSKAAGCKVNVSPRVILLVLGGYPCSGCGGWGGCVGAGVTGEIYKFNIFL